MSCSFKATQPHSRRIQNNICLLCLHHNLCLKCKHAPKPKKKFAPTFTAPPNDGEKEGGAPQVILFQEATARYTVTHTHV